MTVAPFVTEGFGFYSTITDIGTTGSTGSNAITWAAVSGTLTGGALIAGTYSGTQYFKPTGNVKATLTTPQTSLTVGMRTTILGVNGAMQIFDGGNSNAQFSISWNIANQSISANQGSGGTSFGTSANNVFTNNVPFYLEFGYTIANSTGSLTIKINGVTILNFSNIKTQQTASATADTFRWLVPGTPPIQFTDFYCSTAGFVGDIHCPTVFPNGTVSTQWTPLSSTNLSNIDATTQTAKYNFSSTPGQIDLFSTGGISGSPAILGVSVKMQAWKDDAGTRQVASQLVSSSTTGSGATVTMNSTATIYTDFFATDPNTGSAWTDAAVNAAEPGYLEVA